jgi:hypothetical protein
VGFGPAGFDAYARLRFLPDPARPGQSEHDVEAEDWRSDQLPRLFEVLATHTATPEDCYFCVWEGFGVDGAPVATDADADEALYVDDENDAASLAPGCPARAGTRNRWMARQQAPAQGRGAPSRVLAVSRSVGRRRHMGHRSGVARPVSPRRDRTRVRLARRPRVVRRLGR